MVVALDSNIKKNSHEMQLQMFEQLTKYPRGLNHFPLGAVP
jgi:hypothetical protein